MNGIFSALDEKERAKLRLLSLLVLVALLVLIFFSFGQRRSYQLYVERLQGRDKAAATAQAKLVESTAQWGHWQAAYQDIKDLKEKFFYREGEAVSELRGRDQHPLLPVQLCQPGQGEDRENQRDLHFYRFLSHSEEVFADARAIL